MPFFLVYEKFIKALVTLPLFTITKFFLLNSGSSLIKNTKKP